MVQGRTIALRSPSISSPARSGFCALKDRTFQKTKLSTMSANNNVLVWVPGSFAPAAVYDDFRELLHKNGIQTEVVATPSVGRREGKPPGTVTDDVEAIEQVVNSVLAEGKQPIVLAHSYGGIPTTESMKTLAAKNRDGKGVEKIIYLTAVVLPVGMSSFDMQGGTTNLPEYLTYAVSGLHT